MRPWIHVPLSPADRATVAVWSRRVLVAWAFVAASLVAYAFVAQREHGTAQSEKTQQQTKSASHTQRGQR